MNISSNALKNRIEIIYYAILTFCLSKVDRIRDLKSPLLKTSQSSTICDEYTTYKNNALFLENPELSYWGKINQFLPPLIMWIILGFATGFLIGLINPK